MSKQKFWDSIFIKDVYKTDYVLEFCFVLNNDNNNAEYEYKLSKSTIKSNYFSFKQRVVGNFKRNK